MKRARLLATGLLFSVPVGLAALPIFLGKGTEPSSWIILGVLAIVGLPWNIVALILLGGLLWIIAYWANNIDLLFAAWFQLELNGFLILLWLFYGAMVIGAHVNGIMWYQRLQAKKDSNAWEI